VRNEYKIQESHDYRYTILTKNLAEVRGDTGYVFAIIDAFQLYTKIIRVISWQEWA
jgi:hypothetical protein